MEKSLKRLRGKKGKTDLKNRSEKNFNDIDAYLTIDTAMRDLDWISGSVISWDGLQDMYFKYFDEASSAVPLIEIVVVHADGKIARSHGPGETGG